MQQQELQQQQQRVALAGQQRSGRLSSAACWVSASTADLLRACFRGSGFTLPHRAEAYRQPGEGKQSYELDFCWPFVMVLVVAMLMAAAPFIRLLPCTERLTVCTCARALHLTGGEDSPFARGAVRCDDMLSHSVTSCGHSMRPCSCALQCLRCDRSSCLNLSSLLRCLATDCCTLRAGRQCSTKQ